MIVNEPREALVQGPALPVTGLAGLAREIGGVTGFMTDTTAS
jgi:hypothetical protein